MDNLLNGGRKALTGEPAFLLDAVSLNKLIKSYNELLSIAKRCTVILGNEANYPEGTSGYKLCSDAKQAINNCEQ